MPGGPKSAAEIASLSLEKTVGTDPSICATTDTITVGIETDVVYCYTVTNTGNENLVVHYLEDAQLGTILNEFPYMLTPSASAFLTATDTVTTSAEYLATWTAKTGIGVSASDSDVAKVVVVMPSLELKKTVGTNPHACATTDSVTVAPGTEVTYCYEVTNTGLTVFTLHDLTDDQLGSILTNFPYNLVPTASAFLTITHIATESSLVKATWQAAHVQWIFHHR